MANCVRCGRELPAFTLGELRDVCSDCARVSPDVSESAPVAVKGPARPITTALVAINVAVFALMVVRGVSPVQPSVEQLLQWGADWGPLTLGGQWWRVVSSTFLHIGIIHLALNMWCLWELGGLAETIFRRANFLLVYMLCAVGGSVGSLAWHPQTVSAGASGAVFGVAGALIAAFYVGHLDIPRPVIAAKLRSVLLFAAYNLAYGALRPHIDNAAHLGGLVTGLALGALLARRLRADQQGSRRLVFVAAAFAMLCAVWAVGRVNGYVVHEHAGWEALRSEHYDAAIREFTAVVGAKPRRAGAHFLLGEAYARSHQYRAAETAYLHAIGLDPDDADAYEKLGLVYLATKRFQPAHTVLTKGLALNPSSTEGQTYLGMALEGLERNKEALAAYQKAIALDATYAYAHYRLGVLQLNLQRREAALAALQNAARLEPDDADYQVTLAAAYRANGMIDEAKAALVKAESLSPRKP